MSNDGKQVVLTPGFQTAFRVRAVPKTEFKITPPAIQLLRELEETVTFRGTCKNLPQGEGVSVDVTWLVKPHEDDVATGPVTHVDDSTRPRPKLVVTGRAWTLTLKVNAVDLRLYGKGALGVTLNPDFPYCPSATLDPHPLQFHNECRVKLGGGTDVRVGDLLQFAPDHKGFFGKLPTRMQLFEYDKDAPGPELDHEGFSPTFEWKVGNTDSQRYRVGCRTLDPPHVLGTDDDKAGGKYELAATFAVQVPGSTAWTPVPGRVLTGKDPDRDLAPHGAVKLALKFKEFTSYDVDAWKGRSDAELPPELTPHLRGVAAPASRPPAPLHRGKSEVLRRGPTRKVGPDEDADVIPVGTDRWVYVFERDLGSDAIKLRDELYVDEDAKYHRVEWKGKDEKTLRERRTQESSATSEYELAYEPDRTAIYMCLSRVQLPWLRLQEYLGDPLKVRNRCLRVTHEDDAELTKRYLDVTAPGKATLHLYEPMRIMEELQDRYMEALEGHEKYQQAMVKPIGAGGDVQRVSQRYLAGLAVTIADAIGKEKSDPYLNRTDLDAYIRRYDDEAARLEHVVEALAWCKRFLHDDAGEALEDPHFVGNEYLEVQDDLAGLEDAKKADARKLSDGEKTLYSDLVVLWQVHKDHVKERETRSRIGADHAFTLLSNPKSWEFMLFQNRTGGTDASGMVQYIADKSFKWGRKLHRDIIRKSSGFVVLYLETMLTRSKELGKLYLEGSTAIEAYFHVKAVNGVLLTRVEGYHGIYMVENAVHQEAGGLKTFVAKAKYNYSATVDGEVLTIAGEFHFPARGNETKLIYQDLISKTNAYREAYQPPITKWESKLKDYTKLHDKLQKVTLAFEGINLTLRLYGLFSALTSDKELTTFQKVQLGFEVASALDKTLAAAQLLMTKNTRIWRIARIANRLSDVFTYATEVLALSHAVSEGKYGEAGAHATIALGAAVLVAASFAGAAGLTVFGMGALAATGVGLVLVIGGTILLFIFSDGADDDEPMDPAQRWLDSCTWGKHKREKYRPMDEQYRGAVFLLSQPEVVVSIVANPKKIDHYPWIVELVLTLDVFPPFYVDDKSMFEIFRVSLVATNPGGMVLYKELDVTRHTKDKQTLSGPLKPIPYTDRVGKATERPGLRITWVLDDPQSQLTIPPGRGAGKFERVHVTLQPNYVPAWGLEKERYRYREPVKVDVSKVSPEDRKELWL